MRSRINGVITAAVSVTVLSSACIPGEETEAERLNDLLKAAQLVGGSQDLDSRCWAPNHPSSPLRLEELERAQVLSMCRSQLLLLLLHYYRAKLDFLAL